MKRKSAGKGQGGKSSTDCLLEDMKNFKLFNTQDEKQRLTTSSTQHRLANKPSGFGILGKLKLHQCSEQQITKSDRRDNKGGAANLTSLRLSLLKEGALMQVAQNLGIASSIAVGKKPKSSGRACSGNSATLYA